MRLLTQATGAKILGLFSAACAGALCQDSGTNNGAVTQSVYNAYWVTGNGSRSLAQLHNNLLSEPLNVQPVLFLPDGSDVPLPVVALLPLGNATVDIAAELAKLGKTAPISGSAVFRYRRKYSGALAAEIYVENTEESLSFTIPSSEKPPASATQNAVFWLPSPNAEVYVALQNASNVPIRV